jgi:PleD family two-component response regulator
LVFEIPIIVLTSEDDERSLSNYVMEQGAADTVIRGQFSRLVDAIEFGLIRQKLKTDARIKTEKTLSSSHDHNTNLQENSKTNIRAYNERHKQILRMFSGDYSVDSSDKVTLSD